MLRSGRVSNVKIRLDVTIPRAHRKGLPTAVALTHPMSNPGSVLPLAHISRVSKLAIHRTSFTHTHKQLNYSCLSYYGTATPYHRYSYMAHDS
jgi:hypothetical protein